MRRTIAFHVHTLQAGGIERVLIEILRALPEAEYRIILSIGFHLGPLEVLRPQVLPHVEVRYAVAHPLLTRIRRKKAEGYLHPAEKALGEVLLPPMHAQLLRKAAKKLSAEADVVVDFDMTLAAHASALKPARTAAFCHFSLAHYWNGQPAKLARLARRLEAYDRVVMLCDEMKESAAALYPRLAPKLVRLYNALDLDAVRTKAKEGLSPAEAALTPDGYFVSVGRLQEAQKDFSTLIRAYAHGVRRWAWKEVLVIVGDGQSRGVLEALAAEEGVANRVHFTGFENNPFRWMAGARAFLFASKYEGLPTVLIEALALGLPIVATACPTGVRELLVEGKAGMLVPVADAAAVAEAVQKLRTDGALRAAQAAAAESLLPLFDIRRVIADFQQVVLGDDG